MTIPSGMIPEMPAFLRRGGKKQPGGWPAPARPEDSGWVEAMAHVWALVALEGHKCTEAHLRRIDHRADRVAAEWPAIEARGEYLLARARRRVTRNGAAP